MRTAGNRCLVRAAHPTNLNQADQAMYQAKQQGKNSYRLSTPMPDACRQQTRRTGGNCIAATSATR
ncbi:hypothetical protein D3C84_940390 [compost metagenome]